MELRVQVLNPLKHVTRIYGGHGSPVVKITDSWMVCHGSRWNCARAIGVGLCNLEPHSTDEDQHIFIFPKFHTTEHL
ncbi:hypothetical protein TNCV_3724641 [Trichonephila clavipes]|nr:hypothetical protein TNCV_3724641 [Trichonephila clavipes]